VLAGEADLVIGSRFLDVKADIPAYRRAGQRVLNWFTNLSTDGSSFATTNSQSGIPASLLCHVEGRLERFRSGFPSFRQRTKQIMTSIITHWELCS